MKITLVPKISPGGTVSVGNSFVRPKLGLHALLEKNALLVDFGDIYACDFRA